MGPCCSKEVVQALLHIDNFSKLFARATLYDLDMQTENPTVLAVSAFLFGLYAAAAAGSSEQFGPKDVRVVLEAWRNVAKEILSSYTEDEMERLMHERVHMLARTFAQMRSVVS